MFGDYGWNSEPTERRHLARMAWIERVKETVLKPVVIELGAGVAIPSVRNFAVRARQEFAQAGARLIRVNPQQAAVSGTSDVGLQMGALAALHAIRDALADPAAQI